MISGVDAIKTGKALVIDIFIIICVPLVSFTLIAERDMEEKANISGYKEKQGNHKRREISFQVVQDVLGSFF